MIASFMFVAMSLMLPITQPPTPVNAFAQFAGNKFDSWHISRRIVMNLSPKIEPGAGYRPSRMECQRAFQGSSYRD